MTRKTTLYACCECHTVNRWEISRCVNVLSDGFPCGHYRHEHHCRPIVVKPRQDDAFLPRRSSREWSGILYSSATQRHPQKSSIAATRVGQISGEREANALDPIVWTDIPTSGNQAIFPQPSDIPGKTAVVRNSSDDLVFKIGCQFEGIASSRFATAHDPYTGDIAAPLVLGVQPVHLSDGESTHGSLCDVSNSTVANSSRTRQRQTDPKTDSHSSGKRRRLSGPSPSNRENARNAIGIVRFNIAKDRSMWACPFEKFSPGRSDCSGTSYETEDYLHYHHFQHHVESDDISRDEYVRITKARKFRAGEVDGLDDSAKNMKHWQKRFVAIYPCFESVESLLMPEMGVPLLADHENFHKIRFRQLRAFEAQCRPFQYAYLPQRTELEQKNRDFASSQAVVAMAVDLDVVVVEDFMRGLQAQGVHLDFSNPTFGLPANPQLVTYHDTTSDQIRTHSPSSSMINEAATSVTVSRINYRPVESTILQAETRSATPFSCGRPEVDSVFTTATRESCTPITEVDDKVSSLYPWIVAKSGYNKASHRNDTDSSSRSVGKAQDGDSTPMMLPSIHDLNDLHEEPQDQDKISFDNADEVTEMLNIKAREEELEQMHQEEADRHGWASSQIWDDDFE